MKEIKAFINCISYYLPEKVVTNEDLSATFPKWNAEKVYDKVGIKERHIAYDNETAADLAEKAARKLFAEHNIDPSRIDFILLCTQSPDYKLPSTACILQARLGIPTSAGAFDYNLGCSGCVYGMGVAKGLIYSGLAKNVLLLTAETYNKYIHPSDISNLSIFGDGAAACLISSERGMLEMCDFVFGTDGSKADNLIVRTRGSRNPEPSGHEQVDDDGHVIRDDYLYMNGSAILNFTLDTVPQMINELMKISKLGVQQIDYYIFHQANKFMLNTLRKVCSIEKDKFYINLENYGNTVSSTVLIGLKDCLENHTIHEGMNIMIAGFGVGLSYSAAILKM